MRRHRPRAQIAVLYVRVVNGRTELIYRDKTGAEIEIGNARRHRHGGPWCRP